MRYFFISLAAGLALLGNSFLFSSIAQAGSSGLVSLHTLKRVNNRLCMDGHFHYGADSSPVSKAAALANAKRKWASFVVLEYGTDWGRFSLATAKGGTCTGTKGSYHCSVEASPCKALRGYRTVRKIKRRARRSYRHRRAAVRKYKRHRRASRKVRYKAKRRIRMARHRSWR